ncbi:hypothetical protein dsat_2273 [Alkalidesulfovibrio alkalitolerans DSM 16529]|uniref:HD domain-containing protein n=1 Tax=Alkalidesulfovibrio alkalitolerans DSM 16529 TaxID=1121439 RepID=S7TEA2_9BACT|nr:HD domain-containing protein [Alkalidesulfovibrio alkalitolerans]EPR34910.1 hypothetical protein dsat_2273 [Alkalidesulfovibrio alkalitolerans DSM 16529]
MAMHPLKRFRDDACRLAQSLPRPGFATSFAREIEAARMAFFEETLIGRLRDEALSFLYDDFGFGIEHSKAVAVDAAAIVLAETSFWTREDSRRMALLAILAGLLHDATRLDEDGEAKAAELSRSILAQYPLTDEERDIIARAIRDHEIRDGYIPPCDPRAALLSAALYDADKFRYGPDIYVTSLWEFCDYEDMPTPHALKCLSAAENRLPELSGTFRSRPGRSFGEEHLECGARLMPHLTDNLRNVLADIEASPVFPSKTQRPAKP